MIMRAFDRVEGATQDPRLNSRRVTPTTRNSDKPASKRLEVRIGGMMGESEDEEGTKAGFRSGLAFNCGGA
jgi:hypothetical protein